MTNQMAVARSAARAMRGRRLVRLFISVLFVLHSDSTARRVRTKRGLDAAAG